MDFDTVISKLYALANAETVSFKEKKFGIKATNSLGIFHADLKVLAKEIGKNSILASRLFDTGIYEARILCSKIFDTKELTEELMDSWVTTFDNWEICDSFCMGLFARSNHALAKILEWTEREREFEKRAGFAIMATYCMADKKADNKVFEQFFPIIIRASEDDRLYVKKAVNWALRNIGKRNVDLHKKALATAHIILKKESNAAKWIANDALRKLQREGFKFSDYPRSIYRE